MDGNLHSWDLVAVVHYCRRRCIRNDGRDQEEEDGCRLGMRDENGGEQVDGLDESS